MYQLDQSTANTLKGILLNTPLTKSISIEKNDFIFKTNAISKNYKSEETNSCFCFLQDGEIDVLKSKNKSYELFLQIGSWGDTYRLNKSHICLGTNYNGFGAGKSFFSQLELSDAIQDERKIYILKNLSKLAGNGSIARLNSGLNSKESKHLRRDYLKKATGYKTIILGSDEWIIVSKIDKYEMKSKPKVMFNSFINDFLNYSFCIEDIIDTT